MSHSQIVIDNEMSSVDEIEVEKVNILGVGISPVNIDLAKKIVFSWIDNYDKRYICVTPAHGVMECVQDSSLKRIFNNSGMTTPDGMSIVWILNLMGFKEVDRVYGPDLMEAICEHSSKHRKYSHFLYGGAEGTPEKLAKNLLENYPNLNIVGTYSPPFRELTPQEDEEIIETINDLAPDFVWVGISTPKQEKWMASHIDKLNASVLVGVGAAFDFLSGNKNQAPIWIQRSGLEWLYRLISEPKRLWKRYLNYPYFLFLVVRQFLGIESY